MKNIRQLSLVSYFPTKFSGFIIIFFLILNSIFSLSIPYLIMTIIDSIDNRTIKLQEILFIISLFLIQLIISTLSFYLVNRLAESIVKKLRNQMFDNALHLPIQFFDNNRSGQIASGIINDTEEILDFITGHLSQFFSGIITLIGSVFLLFLIDYKITFLLLVAIPSALLISSYFNKKESEISRNYREKISELQSEIVQSLSGIRLIKAFGTEEYTKKKGQELFKELHDYGVLEGKILGMLSPLSSLVIMTMLIVVFGYGSHRVVEGTLSNGELVASVMYLFQLAEPFDSLMSFFANYQKFLVALSRINKLLDLPREEVLYSQYLENIEIIEESDVIKFSDVMFQYDTGRDVLIDINCTIPIGKTTAIIGMSGSGKSTLLSLLERFYVPRKGKIFYKGNDIQGIAIKEWRNNLSYVSQETQVIYGTVIENLTYGVSQYDFSKLEQLVKDLGLYEYIQNLPNKYNSLVGENGAKLSGGQKQRISLIRAILRDSEIVLLDEPTSSLDNSTEAMVQKVIEKYLLGKTVVIVAHRLNTILNSDKVIVIDDHRIQLSGGHSDLLDNPLYQKIMNQSIDSKG